MMREANTPSFQPLTAKRSQCHTYTTTSQCHTSPSLSFTFTTLLTPSLPHSLAQQTHQVSIQHIRKSITAPTHTTHLSTQAPQSRRTNPLDTPLCLPPNTTSHQAQYSGEPGLPALPAVVLPCPALSPRRIKPGVPQGPRHDLHLETPGDVAL
ncbi:hypothetical protein E2C01_091752 [Portunus trituberculatus]|uniref:Uncharacterized protein n=1 Tax=Portunus trituberculatus TaxID=210409 RepID=A0A5B7JID1_PORTR|nr:hypothetical protein [Portunus trituberculatus]